MSFKMRILWFVYKVFKKLVRFYYEFVSDDTKYLMDQEYKTRYGGTVEDWLYPEKREQREKRLEGFKETDNSMYRIKTSIGNEAPQNKDKKKE